MSQKLNLNFRIFVSIVCLLSISILYQNCGQGFQIDFNSINEVNSIDPDTEVVDSEHEDEDEDVDPGDIDTDPAIDDTSNDDVNIEDEIVNLKGVLFYDDLESGNTSKNMDGFKWGGPRGRSGEKPKVSSDIAHSGSKSIKFTFLAINEGSTSSWSEQPFYFGKNMKEVYIQYYLYYPDGTEGLGAKYVHRMCNVTINNNKFFRIWDDEYTQFHIKTGFSTRCHSKYGPYIQPEKGTNGNGTGYYDMPKIDYSGNFENNRARWIQVKMHFKTDDGSGNGVLRLTLDGEDIINFQNQRLYPKNKDKNYFKRAYFLGAAASGFAKTTHIYMDDLIISDSPIQ